MQYYLGSLSYIWLWPFHWSCRLNSLLLLFLENLNVELVVWKEIMLPLRQNCFFTEFLSNRWWLNDSCFLWSRLNNFGRLRSLRLLLCLNKLLIILLLFSLLLSSRRHIISFLELLLFFHQDLISGFIYLLIYRWLWLLVWSRLRYPNWWS